MCLFQLSSRPPDLDQLSKQIAKIGRIEKCEGCGCYVDTINEFKAVLDQTPDEPAPARERIAELEAKHRTTHGCIGCDPCYPVAISNTLYAISDGASVENVKPIKFDVSQNEADCGTSCEYEAPQEIAKPTSVEPRPKIAWPIETGDYRLGSDDGCVAIATLASEDLYHHFSDTTCGDCAICGKVFTENIGIEKVVKNIIANRHIRFLILCGQEAKGHLTVGGLKGLHAKGLADSRRIAGAPGKRPWIKTISPAQILYFLRQIEIVDLIGCEEVAAIEKTVAKLAARNPGPLPEAIIAESVPHYIASKTGRLHLDKAGFFIIHSKPEADWLIVEHYKNSGEPTYVIEGTDPAAICAEIINRGLVSQLDHAAYLGRELERAKLSIKLGFAFTQDRAFGELETKAEWYLSPPRVMPMKQLLLALIVAAAAGIVIYKMMNRAEPAPAQTAVTSSASTSSGKPVFYLFHDPADQDEGCRRIYSFADRARRELAGKIEVKRPDVKSEKGVVDKYQVRVLPTILVVDAGGAVKERFEGEEKETAARLEDMMTRLKTSLR